MRHRIIRAIGIIRGGFFLTSLLVLAFSFLTVSAQEQQPIVVEHDSLLLQGKADYSSDFFDTHLLHNTLGSFMNNYVDFVTFQTQAVGDFNTPDQHVIAVQGNSYRWTKYYLDNFRIDSRVTPGDALYNIDMYRHSLSFDVYNGTLKFTPNAQVDDAVSLRYNKGYVGGETPGTEVFYMIHSTVLEKVFQPIDYRKHITGAGTFSLDYTVDTKREALQQHLYVDFGQRELVALDYNALATPYYDNYMKVELIGELPRLENAFFDDLNYAFAFSQNDQLFHQFYYNENETGEGQRTSVSLFGSKAFADSELTTGLTYSRSSEQHNDLDFSRNMCDMDGESLSPYYIDASYSEFSHAFNYEKRFTDQLSLKADAYNSFVHTNAADRQAQNALYYESRVAPNSLAFLDEDTSFYQSLYDYQWRADDFNTLLMENSVGLDYPTQLLPSLSAKVALDLTFDGLVLRNKHMLTPNWEADLFLTWQPSSSFSLGLNVARKRVAYHFDMARYISDDYMNADIYYWDDANNDKVYQASERSDYFTSTGGQYHTLADDLKQPSYFILDIPLVVKVGERHTFSMVSTYKKYNNMWQTTYDKSADKYGHFETTRGEDIFYLNGGEAVQYVINSDPHPSMQMGQDNAFLTNSPFWMSNIIKYKYNSPKVFFSLSWVSQASVCPSVEGNSPKENNVELLSEADANPNSSIRQLGRPQQDRGYVAHLLYGYRFSPNFNMSFMLKFIDGQPFSRQTPYMYTDASTGNSQFVSTNYSHKGDTPYHDNFGFREDFIVNSELRAAYTFHLQNTAIELNASSYNLIDVVGEINSAGFYLPTNERTRNSVELQMPRGVMFTAKVGF